MIGGIRVSVVFPVFQKLALPFVVERTDIVNRAFADFVHPIVVQTPDRIGVHYRMEDGVFNDDRLERVLETVSRKRGIEHYRNQEFPVSEFDEADPSDLLLRRSRFGNPVR